MGEVALIRLISWLRWFTSAKDES